jgi:hypothetical protein
MICLGLVLSKSYGLWQAAGGKAPILLLCTCEAFPLVRSCRRRRTAPGRFPGSSIITPVSLSLPLNLNVKTASSVVNRISLFLYEKTTPFLFPRIYDLKYFSITFLSSSGENVPANNDDLEFKMILTTAAALRL